MRLESWASGVGLQGCKRPMKGDARATKEASPTPTSMRHRMRLQKPQASPQPAVATVQMPRPTAMRRKALWCLLASAKMGEDTSKPTCKNVTINASAHLCTAFRSDCDSSMPTADPARAMPALSMKAWPCVQLMHKAEVFLWPRWPGGCRACVDTAGRMCRVLSLQRARQPLISGSFMRRPGNGRVRMGQWVRQRTKNAAGR